MKYISSKWLQTCVLIVTVVALVFVGCGGGGGGGSSSEPIKTRTLTGVVMAPVAPNASLISATGNSPVPNAKVWLEGFSNILPQYTDASGTYAFIGVPAAEHFVVASFEYAGKTYKQRVRAQVQNTDVDVKAPNIDVEEASTILTGVLKDSSGNVLPVGTEMKLWGEVFTIGNNGSFTTPPLPVSVSQGEIFVKLPGGNTFTSFFGPFIGGSTPAFIEQTVLLPDSGNVAPSGVLLAKNSSGIKTVSCVTSEQLNFSLTAHDPDSGHLNNLKYQWAASRGTLQVTGNQTTANWVAMDSYGVATVSVVITDPKGASGKVSLRVLVNIQSMDQTDTTSPTIVSRTPAANTIGVTPGSTISVVFSEALLASSVTSGAITVTSQGTAVSGASSLQADKKTIIWTPTTVLPGNQTITVALLPTISDLYSNQIGDQSSWTFTTALVPGVTVNSLYTNDTTPEITGTVDDPETTVLVTVNSKTYSATLNGTSWTAQVTDALPDAVYNVSVVATNKMGITGSDSSSNELTVDTGAKTAVLSNLPPVVTSSKQTAITVGGTGVVKYLYRYRMLGDIWGSKPGSSWSDEKAISEKIALSDLEDGIYNLQVRAIDAPGNIQLESEATVFEWTIDTTVKFAQFDANTLPQNPTNQTTTNITVVGAGVQFYRFRLNGGSWSTNYPITTPIALVGLKSGDNTISVIGGDSYGNWQSPDDPESFTWEIDANVKIAVLENKPANPTNSKVANITVAGTDVINYMYSIDGGATWSDPASVSVVINLPALVDGAHSIRVVGGDRLDTWQNKANATVWNWYVDTVEPEVSFSTAPDITNVPVPMVIVFSEPVAAFDLSFLTVSNCTLGNLRQINAAGTEWTFEISPAVTGPVSVKFLAGAVSDLAGNLTEEEVELSFDFDTINPLPTFTPANIAPTSSAVTITLSFDKSVEGFDLNDLTIVNAVANTLTVVSDKAWSFVVTPLSQGEVTVGLAANMVTDSAGNGNHAARQISFMYDSIKPTVALSTTSASPTNTSPISVLVTFSETVSGFDLVEDIAVVNGNASNLQVVTAGKEWSFDVAPGQGQVTVGLAADVVEDAAGNKNSAALPIAVSYDSVRPSATLATTVTTPTSASPVPVAIEFSENMPGFMLSNLTITNGTAGNLQVVMTDKAWTFDVVPSGKGEVIISLLENRVTDPAGNGNLAAIPVSIYYDSDRPAATLTTTANSTVNTSPITVFVEFNKDVVNFDTSKLTIGNGVISGSASTVTSFRKWSFLVNASGQGAVTVDLAANKVVDSAGNGNTAAAQLRVIFDSLSPTVSITSTSPASTNASSIPITITFSDAVSGFDSSDLVPGNCIVGSFQPFAGNKVWTAVLTPSAPGQVTVALPADRAIDAAGNGNTAATTLSRNYDIDRPTVALSTSKPDPTNANPIPVTVTFNEEVSGFNIGQLVVGNGSAGNLQVAIASRAWTVDITPNGEGLVTIDMPAGNVTDVAGNTNTAAARLSLTYDSVKPAAVITSALNGSTNGNPFLVTVTFNKDVSGFVAGNLTLGNGAPANAVNTIAKRVWTVEIWPTADGAVDIDLNADLVYDAAGNGNTAAPRLTIQSDRTSPTVDLFTAVVSPTSTNPIPVTITFSETVTGFALSDLVVSNGSAQSLQNITAGKVWTVDIIPANNGAITINLAAGTAVDTSGNGNTIAEELSVTYSSDRPTPVFTSLASNPTNNNPIAVTIEFNEDVTGFEQSDLVIANCTIGNMTNPTPGSVWNFEVTPTSNGLVTVGLPENRVLNAASNGNTAAAQFSRTYDSVRPTATLTTTSPEIISSGSIIPVTITFSKDVTEFDLSYLTLPSGIPDNLQSVTDNRVWSFDITPPPGDGVITVSMAENKVFDIAGNGNTAASAINVTFDSTPPSATLSSVAAGTTTSLKTRPVTVTFGETVSGLILADITVTNGFAGNLQAGTPAGEVWTFDVTATNNDLVQVYFPAGGVVDGAGNGNTAAAQISWTYDSGKPSAALTTTAPPITTTSPIPVTITFGEPVSGFELGDLVVSNGDASNLNGATPGTVFTVDVAPDGNGAVTVNLPADIAIDSAGNGNTAATQLSVVYDTAAPVVTLTTATTSPTKITPFQVTITFNEDVAGFDWGDVSVGNGNKGSLSEITANRVWRMFVTPVAHGDVTVDVAAGAAKDLAGNNNAAAAQLKLACDTVKPTATISSTVSSPTGAASIPMLIEFVDEWPVNFSISTLVVSNGYAISQAVVEEGKKWSFNILPSISSGTITVDLPADRVNDAAGNGNQAADRFSIVYDKLKPSATLSTTATNPTNDDPFEVTITFNEKVNGFDENALSITNGSAGAAQPVSDRIWTVNVTPSAAGLVTVNLPADKVTDDAGNFNIAATQLSRNYDGTEPTVTLSTTAPLPPATTNTNPIPVTITFSEDVAGFDSDYLVVAGGDISGAATLVMQNRVWMVNVVPDAGSVTVTINMAAGLATDTAGNFNSAATELSVNYNSVRPTVTFTSAAPPRTKESPISFTVNFNKEITGFDLTDLTIGNGTAGNLSATTPGRTYTFDVTPAYNGTVTVDMAAGKVKDLSNNDNNAAAQISRIYDTIRPSATLTPVTGLTNGTAFVVTVTFSEDVVGLDAADFVISSCTVGLLTEISGKVWTVTATPTADPVTISLPADVVTDVAGNNNFASNQIVFKYDNGKPSVTLTTDVTGPTNASNIPVTIEFSEEVTGFEMGDLTFSNATIGDFAETGSQRTWSVNLEPTGSSPVTLAVGANVAQDLAGNFNTAAAPSISIEYDGTEPTVALVTSSALDGTYTTTNVIEILVEFSEDVQVTGSPTLTLETGAVDRTIICTGSYNARTLKFTYTVQGGDTSPDLDYTSTTALAFNGATIKDTVGNDAVLTLPEPGVALVSLGGSKDIVIDTSGPSVENVTSNADDGIYTVGGIIEVAVQFDRPVFVTGTPRLTLETGIVDRTVNYTSSSGDTMVFSYTVAAGDNSADLDYTTTTALALGGGIIADNVGNNAVLTLPAPGDTGSLSANKGIVIDTRGPTVLRVRSSSDPLHTYVEGETISIQVEFSEIVNLAGNLPEGPKLLLNVQNNTPDVGIASATYVVSPATSTLNFIYTVRPGDFIPFPGLLDYTSSTALNANNTVFRDAVLNLANLTLPAPGTTNSLRTSSIVIFDP